MSSKSELVIDDDSVARVVSIVGVGLDRRRLCLKSRPIAVKHHLNLLALVRRDVLVLQ